MTRCVTRVLVYFPPKRACRTRVKPHFNPLLLRANCKSFLGRGSSRRLQSWANRRLQSWVICWWALGNLKTLFRAYFALTAPFAFVFMSCIIPRYTTESNQVSLSPTSPAFSIANKAPPFPPPPSPPRRAGFFSSAAASITHSQLQQRNETF